VVVARIDGTANEHLQLKFVGFPTIQLWSPTNDVTVYKSHRTLKDLSDLLDRTVGPAPPLPDSSGSSSSTEGEGDSEGTAEREL
jgi:hypothetical protein